MSDLGFKTRFIFDAVSGFPYRIGLPALEFRDRQKGAVIAEAKDQQGLPNQRANQRVNLGKRKGFLPCAADLQP
jgi:hypothetical protein